MSAGHRLAPSCLREYDIRGVYGETLTEADAGAVGRAFGTRIARAGGSSVAVGRDGRLSSPALEAAVAEGLRATGLAVKRIGVGPTPMLYFAVHHLAAAGGIMVTGSHNPPDFNGFKMMLGHGPFFGADIQALGKLAEAGDFASGAGTATEIDLRQDYVDRMLRDFEPGRELVVAWDAGNGATGEILEMMAQRLPGRHVLLNEKIDGTFPSHHPDPTVPENLAELIRTVRGIGADLGIAFDGDGDRIGIVDGRGRILWGDQILLLLARDLLPAHPGATIIADVKASQVLFDGIAEAGGVPLMYKTGHSLIKAKMAELGCPLAGEMSGHIFFADRYYGFDDAPYVALRFLAMAARADRTVSEMWDALPKVVNTPELRFESSDGAKFEIVTQVRERLLAAGAEVNAIDGVRVTTADGWWLLRASNTQPVLVARCEARDEAGLARLKGDLVAALEASGVARPEGL